jgi:putative chitinase
MEQIKALQRIIGSNPDGVIGPRTLATFGRHYGFTPEQTAHFFGQAHHETGGFRLWVENLNYSAELLVRVWPRHFTPEIAAQYARQPERIGNRAYANRMGNGNEASGDGWRFRGRGAFQLTGRDNYIAYTRSSANAALTTPDRVATDWAFDSAVWFFRSRRIHERATVVNDAAILSVTRLINGGTHGLADRLRRTFEFYRMMQPQQR